MLSLIGLYLLGVCGWSAHMKFCHIMYENLVYRCSTCFVQAGFFAVGASGFRVHFVALGTHAVPCLPLLVLRSTFPSLMRDGPIFRKSSNMEIFKMTHGTRMVVTHIVVPLVVGNHFFALWHADAPIPTLCREIGIRRVPAAPRSSFSKL